MLPYFVFLRVLRAFVVIFVISSGVSVQYYRTIAAAPATAPMSTTRCSHAHHV